MLCAEGHADCQRKRKIMQCLFNPNKKQCVHADTDCDPTSQSISEDHKRISGDEMWLWHTYRHTRTIMSSLYSQGPETALVTLD